MFVDHCGCVACSYGALDVRRKNATRESTSTLKAWLYEHIKNPYPTKGEKIMLAIITKMTLTQVTTYPGQVAHTDVPLSPNTTKLHSDLATTRA